MDDFLSSEIKKQIFEKIIEKVGKENMKCPMCKGRGFSIADGYFTDVLQSDMKTKERKKVLVTVGTICVNCGFVNKHVLGALKSSKK